MTSQLKTPVAFLIFNRPETTFKVFESIRKAKPTKLLIVADGARFPEEEFNCNEARSIIRKVDWNCEVLTNFSKINLGCKLRVSSGLDWIFSEVEEAIILEDDCLPTLSFFYFCQTLLEYYRNDERIMHISGNNFQFSHQIANYSYFFSKYGGIWGWASWRRAWQHYDRDMKTWGEFKRTKMIDCVCDDFYEKIYWTKIFDHVIQGIPNTWDYQWLYARWAQSYLSIVPAVNLVSNIGFNSSATHTNQQDHLANLYTEDIWEITHPPFVVRNRLADADIFEHCYNEKLLNKALQKIKIFFKNSFIKGINIMDILKSIKDNLNYRLFLINGKKPWSRGYSVYKERQIQKILDRKEFDVNLLKRNYGLRLDERVVEYPWLFSQLPNYGGYLLDAGSALNHSFLLSREILQSKHLFISTLSPESNCFWNKNVSYVYEDLRETCYKDNFFDWVVCISTLEHIGLDNTMLYTNDVLKNENNSESYLDAIREFNRVLKTGGILYLTFPFGKYVNHSWFQVFNNEMLDSIIEAFSPTSFTEFHYRYEVDGWKVSSREESQNATYFDINKQKEYDSDYAAASRAIACLKMVK